MKARIKAKVNKELVDLVTLFDEMYERMNTHQEMGKEQFLQFLSQQTIANCSNSIQQEDSIEIDEKIKAKIFTRLVREYRRSLEHQ